LGSAQIARLWHSARGHANNYVADHIGGYRASSRLTVIAERDDHGVWRAGWDATLIAESRGFRRVLRIGLRMRDQMVMCSAQAF
jgi:hypothetical protein